MAVRIHDIGGNVDRVYLATTIDQCQSDTDKQVFKLVTKTGEVITMGKVIGEPVKIVRPTSSADPIVPICTRYNYKSEEREASSRERAESRAWVDYNEALETAMWVREVDGFRGEDSEVVTLDEPVKVRVIITPEHDVIRWIGDGLDTHLDPVWMIQIDNPPTQLDGMTSMWIYGHSYRPDITTNAKMVS